MVKLEKKLSKTENMLRNLYKLRIPTIDAHEIIERCEDEKYINSLREAVSSAMNRGYKGKRAYEYISEKVDVEDTKKDYRL